MSHANAALTPRARLRLARLIVEEGWPIARAAERYDVSWPTAKRWADRYRELGAAGHGRSPPRVRTAPRPGPRSRWSARSCTCGGSSDWARSQIADRVGLAPSTVHAVLVRCRINRLSHVDRATGEPIRRYEHPHPGSLIHVDVKKLGNIPDGGGWRYVGRRQGRPEPGRHPGQAQERRLRPPRWAPRSCTPSSTTTPGSPTPRSTTTRPPPPRPACCTAPWPGSPTAASPSSGSCPTTARPTRSHLWRDTCAELGITAKRTRPYRPQTNGKIERFHRTLADGWAFKKFYTLRNSPPSTLCQHGSTSTTTTGPTPQSAGQPPISQVDQPPRSVHPRWARGDREQASSSCGDPEVAGVTSRIPTESRWTVRHRGRIRRGRNRSSCRCPAGRHVVRAGASNWTGSPELDVEVPAGSSVTCWVEPAGGAWLAGWQVAGHDGYLRLSVMS